MANGTDSIGGRVSGGESPVRVFTDRENRRWTVREVTSNQYDRRDARDLVFMSKDIARRVRRYPRDWYLLDDEDLYAVSLGA
jgi:hypothetical protein